MCWLSNCPCKFYDRSGVHNLAKRWRLPSNCVKRLSISCTSTIERIWSSSFGSIIQALDSCCRHFGNLMISSSLRTARPILWLQSSRCSGGWTCPCQLLLRIDISPPAVFSEDASPLERWAFLAGYPKCLTAGNWSSESVQVFPSHKHCIMIMIKWEETQS